MAQVLINHIGTKNWRKLTNAQRRLIQSNRSKARETYNQIKEQRRRSLAGRIKAGQIS